MEEEMQEEIEDEMPADEREDDNEDNGKEEYKYDDDFFEVEQLGEEEPGEEEPGEKGEWEAEETLRGLWFSRNFNVIIIDTNILRYIPDTDNAR